MSAADAFSRNGVGATGLGEVCAGAGVTKGVFSHHFPGGKSELVVEVVAFHSEILTVLLEGVDSELSPVDRLVASFDAYAAILDASGAATGCPVAASIVDGSSASDDIRAAAAATFASWITVIRELSGDEFDEPTAELIVAVFEGAILVARTSADGEPLRRIGRTLAALLAHGR